MVGNLAGGVVTAMAGVAVEVEEVLLACRAFTYMVMPTARGPVLWGRLAFPDADTHNGVELRLALDAAEAEERVRRLRERTTAA